MKKLLILMLLVIISSCSEKTEIKNVIILIGDGMGPQQLGVLTQYARQASNSIYKEKKPGLIQAMEQGYFTLSMTYPGNGLVTDSAASATQFSSGQFSGAEMLGATVEGDATQTILAVAKKMGKKVGLVSDTKISHATPAAFVAKSSHRDHEGAIALQLAQSDTDVMLSGGASYWFPQIVNDKGTALYRQYRSQVQGAFSVKSKRHDDYDLFKLAKERGYQVAFNANQLMNSNGDKLLGLFASSYMPDAIKAVRDRKKGVPTLLEMSQKAISILEKSPKGFFLMIEGGQIDFAGHRNDMGTTLHEMLRFDAVVEYVTNWAKNRDDTVVVITADHETGAPGFSFTRYNLPQPKELNGNVFNGASYLPNYNFGSTEVWKKLYDQQMSYQELFSILKQHGNPPGLLVNMVKKYIGYDISLEEAKKIFEKEKNNYYKKGHPKLGEKTFPRVDDYEEFYVDPGKTVPALLGRVVGKYQNVAWATGTHTSTPVPFIVLGPENVQKEFKGLLHTTIWGSKLKKILEN